MGIQFAAALGAEVVAISSSATKEEEAKKFGATKFINLKDEAQLKDSAGSLDFLLTTHCEGFNWEHIFRLMDFDGIICNVGAPHYSFDLKAKPMTLLARRLKLTGSLIGSPKEFVEMLELAKRNNIYPAIETVAFDQVNEAIRKVKEGTVRYRMVLEIDPNYKP